MPTPSLSLNVLQIQTPCEADWHAMPGTAARRHCADCDLHVHDLAALPRRKAEKLLAQSQTQRVCARVTRDVQGQIITRNRWRTARRQLAAAAGLALSVIGLTGCGGCADASMPASPDPTATTEGAIPPVFKRRCRRHPDALPPRPRRPRTIAPWRDGDASVHRRPGSAETSRPHRGETLQRRGPGPRNPVPGRISAIMGTYCRPGSNSPGQVVE